MITVVTGPMGSGKSLELIRLAKTAELAGKCIQVFKPVTDNRSKAEIKTRFGGVSIPALPFHNLKEIDRQVISTAGVIIIDEVQFIEDISILERITKLSNQEYHVIIGGLNRDFLGRPFGYMPQLMALADEIILFKGVCSVCGEAGTETQRIRNDQPDTQGPLVLCGDQNIKDGIRYECRCKKCAIR